ncbi:hypothetical protein GCM10008956_09970 [Deinococcus arenae]|uniref:Uncharacterized protein n=1 Tax=Deinococcus arenae TaxID=1452751 RepID=A0A8H9GMF3_9DEIO|nr:hypothetical protein [Deinococcus arenae]AWT35354.1 hypothetical protein DM785_07150 [Deinococcus actinosclerus]GGM35515.1 hypothetical protein GCM10008956_09970 [Deinococcus arenae]
MRDLQDAVSGLYTAFGTTPRPTVIQHEPYELQPGEVTTLLGQPLRELPPGLMRSYLCDALYTVGTWDDFRYFLPRLLELLVTDEIELDPIACRLAYAREQGCRLTGTQDAALETFFLTYWDDLLWHFPWYADLALRWGLMEQVGLTRSTLLARWWAHPNRAVVLAEVLLLNGTPPPEWPRAALRDWLETAFFAAEGAEDGQFYSDALLILEHLPDLPGP